MNYPNKRIVIETLLDAARKAAFNSSAQHPDDIAAEMVGALDGAASAIWYLHNRTLIEDDSIDEMGG